MADVLPDGVYFFDGAFGTYYHTLTGREEACELANLTDPATVLSIHRAYRQAGARGLKTNTFGANAAALEGDVLKRVLSAGYSLAKEAAGDEGDVWADIGPISLEGEAAPAAYRQVVEEFLRCGAQNFLFETLCEWEPLLPALELLAGQSSAPRIIISFAVSQDGYTAKGLDYRTLMARAAAHPAVTAVGLNCICGPSHMVQLIRALPALGKPLSAMPNAGYPAVVHGRTIFRDNAAYFARKLLELSQLGVQILGGCCGTTPQHIAGSIAAVAQGEAAPPPPPAKRTPAPPPPRVPALAGLLAAGGRKLIAVEIDPPMDEDPTPMLRAARKAWEAGADIITLADSPLARTRADSLMMAAKLRREVGAEVMPHLSCRDRNRIALQGALLAAHMEGIDHVLAITGDPVPQTERLDRKAVFNLNSFELMGFISSLNETLFAQRPYFLAGALNINAAQFSVELARAQKKIGQGAQMLLTQPIFSQENLARLRQAHEALSCGILAGILPFAGYKNALFLHNEVTGIEIPDEVLAALEGADRARATENALDYCGGVIDAAWDYCRGFYLMTPLRRIDLTVALIQKIRRKQA